MIGPEFAQCCPNNLNTFFRNGDLFGIRSAINQVAVNPILLFKRDGHRRLPPSLNSFPNHRCRYAPCDGTRVRKKRLRV